MTELIILLTTVYIACGIAYTAWDVYINPYMWKDDKWYVQAVIVLILLLCWPIGVYVDGYINNKGKRK